jgi:hypothetical protein
MSNPCKLTVGTRVRIDENGLFATITKCENIDDVVTYKLSLDGIHDKDKQIVFTPFLIYTLEHLKWDDFKSFHFRQLKVEFLISNAHFIG